MGPALFLRIPLNGGSGVGSPLKAFIEVGFGGGSPSPPYPVVFQMEGVPLTLDFAATGDDAYGGTVTVRGTADGNGEDIRVYLDDELIAPGALPRAARWHLVVQRVTDASGKSLIGTVLRPGQRVYLGGDGLPVGATVIAELHSTPRSLGSSIVGDDGLFRLASTSPRMSKSASTNSSRS